jgi:hypothetical protein
MLFKITLILDSKKKQDFKIHQISIEDPTQIWIREHTERIATKGVWDNGIFYPPQSIFSVEPLGD